MVTKKDFEAVAGALRGLGGTPHIDQATLIAVVYALADVFSGLNERFDEDKFLAAAIGKITLQSLNQQRRRSA